MTSCISLISFWKIELSWGWINPRCDSTSDDKGIAVDVNKLKEDVLKRGDNKIEVDRNGKVEKPLGATLKENYVDINRELNENNWYWRQQNGKIKYV